MTLIIRLIRIVPTSSERRRYCRQHRQRERAAARARRYYPLPCPRGRHVIAVLASLGVGRACVERAGRCQSADGCLADIVGSGQVGLDLTGSNALQYFPALMRRQLAWATEAYAASHGARATLTGAFADQLTLELSDATKDRDQQTPMHRRGVCPRIFERAERRATIGYLIQQVQQIAG